MNVTFVSFNRRYDTIKFLAVNLRFFQFLIFLNKTLKINVYF